MRTEKILAAVIGLLILRACLPSHGATYYIDFATGSDANSGTTQSSPKKLHPYMRGYAGSYTHAAGDRFIFKGGVTWPNSCFTMTVLAGGTSGSPDYYGVDQTWYTGGSFVAPIFDAGGVELNGGFDVFVLLNLGTAPSYITFDGFDMRNLFWTGPKSFSQVAFFNLSVSHDITIANCWMHNWTHGTLSSGTTDILKCVIGSNSSPWNPGCVVTGCLIDGENAANSTNGSSSGEGTYAYSGNILNTTVRNAASGFIVTGDPSNHSVPQVVSGCNIGPSYVSFDPNEHPDGLFMNGGNYFWWHDNYIHDCNVEVVFTGEGSGDEDTYIWNNVIWNGTTHAAVEIDNTYSGARIWMYHNTLVTGAFPPVRVINRGNGPLGVLDYRNNFQINDSSVGVTLDAGATITHYTNANNVVLSSSTAFVNGFTAANRFQPPSASAATVGAGQDLSTIPPKTLVDIPVATNGVLKTDLAVGVSPVIRQVSYFDPGLSKTVLLSTDLSTITKSDRIVPAGWSSMYIDYQSNVVLEADFNVTPTNINVRRYSVNGPLATTSTPIDTHPVGDGDSRLGGGVKFLNSGAALFVWHQFTPTNNAGNQDLVVGVSYLPPGSSTWIDHFPLQMPGTPTSLTAFVDAPIAIHPVDGSIWIYFKRDAYHQIDAIKCVEGGGDVTITMHPAVISWAANGAFGPDGEEPAVFSLADPVNNRILLAYERNFRTNFTSTPYVGSYLALASMDQNGNPTSFVSLDKWIERISPFGIVLENGNPTVIYQTISETGVSPVVRASTYIGGVWSPERIVALNGGPYFSSTRTLPSAYYQNLSSSTWNLLYPGSVLTQDILGVRRPQGTRWDAGAYQWVAASPGSISLVYPTYSIPQTGGFVPVTATRSGGTAGAVSVNVATANGTATAGVDYTALSSTFSWPDGAFGSLTKSVPILVSGSTTDRVFTASITGTGGGPSAQAFGGAANNDSGSAVTTDGSGNSYLAGYFVGPASFGGSTFPGRGMVLAKYNSAGTHQWSFAFQATTTVNPKSIVLDPSGNVLVAGFFNDTVNFGGGNITSAGSADAFVAKYTSAGAFVWVKTFGGANSEGFNGVAADSSGNVLVIGWFTGTVSYGGPTPLTSSFAGFAQNVVLAKYNSAGAWQWATNFVSSYYNSGASVGVDAANNVLFSGAFFQSIDFGGGVLNAVSNTYATIFVGKVNSSGTYQWARAYGGVSSQNVVAGVVDHLGDIVIGGGYYRQTDLGGGVINGVAVSQDGYLAKYSGLNGNFVWARNITADNGVWVQCVAVDAANNVLSGGYFQGRCNFGTVTLPSVAISNDGFAARYASTGTPITAEGFGGSGTDQANGVAFDSTGAPVITGLFNGTATFGGQTLTSLGLSDAFLYRIASGVAVGPITTEVITITPPPTPPQPTNAGSISFTSASWSAASTNASVTLNVIRTGSTNIDASVSYATANGTATAGTDYTATSGSLSWASNENSTKTITVPLINSGATGGSRTFIVTISSPSNGATLGTSVATVTITLPSPTPGVISLSTSAASVSETGGSIIITAVRSQGTNGVVGVHIATSDQTAVAGHDYSAISANLSWGDGVVGGQTVTIPILNSGDTAPTNRTFIVTISAPTGGATLTSPTVETVTIIMNPPPVNAGNITFSSANYSTTSSSGNVVLTVIRSGSTNAAASINYSTSNGTAVAGVDYTATSGTLTWVANDNSSRTIVVPIINSGAVGTNRVFNVALTSPSSGVTTGITNAAVTIQLPAPSPGNISLSTSAASISQNSSSIVITLVRSNGTNGIVSVSFSTSDQTAVAGHDYTATSTTVTWADGVFGNRTVSVPILQSGDTAFTNRTFLVTISGPTGGATLVAPTTEVVTIIMNPPPVNPGTITLSSTNYSTTSTSGSVTLTVIRTGSTNSAASVNFATADGTATAGVDYTTTTGTLTWSTNQNIAKAITVPIINSGAVGSTRVFSVTLSGASAGVTLGVTSSTVTIQLPPPVAGSIALATSAASVSENGGSITVTAVRSGGSNGAVSVSAATADGSAVAGHDYTATSTTLNWPDGIFGNQSFVVPILASGDVSNTDRTFTVTLSSPGGGAALVNPTVETITIVMNRPSTNAGSVTPSKTSFSVPLTAGSVTIPVTRTGGTNVAATVNYFTSNGTAIAGTDYTATFGSLSWANNDNTTQNIVVPILNTGKTGTPLSFSLILSTSPGGPQLPTPMVSVSITLNNIAPPNGLRITGNVNITGPVALKFTP